MKVGKRYFRWGLWAAFLATTLPFVYFLFNDVFLWKIERGVSYLGIAAGLGVLAYIGWRSFAQRKGMPITGLEIPLVFGVVAVVFSLLFSPDRRMAVEQLAWSVAYLVIFYLLVDFFEAGASRTGVIYGLLCMSGLVAVFAVLETYVWYLNYWQGTGEFFKMPPYPYRLVSILGHPNFYMAFVNLFAPLAVAIVLRTRRKFSRIFAILWLVFYLISVPFSSSRGGWLGMLTWMGVMMLFWVLEDGRLRRWWDWLKRFDRLSTRLLLAVAAVVILAGGLFAGLKAWNAFSAHPSHGGGNDPLGSRSYLWSKAIEIWQVSPWVGVGIGRYMYEYLRVSPDFPPGFWSFHAHNLFLTTLAEQGVIGLLALLVLVGVGLVQLYRWKRLNLPKMQLWSGAMLAGICGFTVHSVFDDFTTTLPVMLPIAFLAALIRGSVYPRPARPQRVSFGLLLLPFLAGVAVTAWIGRGNEPLEGALQAANQQQWGQAAVLVGESAARDPQYVYYQVQAGMAWAKAWGQSKSTADLEEARAYLRRGREMESNLSLVWANLAVLDWFAGDQKAAVQGMIEAMRLSPAEASYPLNLGWFYEQMGNPDAAAAAYQKALQNPAWAGHPFWQGSELRQRVSTEVLATYRKELELQPPCWKQAQDAAIAGNISEAQSAIALCEAVGENRIAIAVSKMRLAETQGDTVAFEQGYNNLMGILRGDTLGDYPYLANMYARFHKRAGLAVEVVPGYLHIAPDYGQFAVIEGYYRQLAAQGNCAAAEEMRLEMEQSIGWVGEPAPECQTFMPKK